MFECTVPLYFSYQKATVTIVICFPTCDVNHGRRKRGEGDTSPAIKIAGGDVPPKICMKISNSDYFNGFKLDPFKFHHKIFDCRGDIRSNEANSRTYQCHTKYMLFHWSDPKETAEMRPPPARNVWRRPCLLHRTHIVVCIKHMIPHTTDRTGNGLAADLFMRHCNSST